MPHFLILNLGTGSEGCLGHGTLEHSKKPRIVEALLGSVDFGYGVSICIFKIMMIF